jgi:ribosomal-protein-alanine N-acetyltransferase
MREAAAGKIGIMPPAPKHTSDRLVRRGMHVVLRPPARRDERAFLAGVAASRELHANWVSPPTTAAMFRLYVSRYATLARRDLAGARHLGFVLCERDTGTLAGVFNFSEIVHGSLQSAFLGYFAFAGMTGRGYMREGIALALDQAFGVLRLHRVEVNIQPANARSIALVEATGFAREGYSPRYVKVAGRWRDHLRYAILADDWRTLRRARA